MKRLHVRRLAPALALLALACPAFSDTSPAPAPTPPPAPATPATAATAPAAAAERTRWFREARFGLFIHWGVYAVPAGEWRGEPVKGIGEWIMVGGQIPVADYRAFAKDFTAANYDPRAWASLARRAGMRYVVLTGKHHDGFALWDSAASEWNAVKSSAAGRDLIAPLADAVRAEGLQFGLYYSQAQDWINPGGAFKWGGPFDPAQKGDFDHYLQTVALPQTRELIERYDPAILWWDTPDQMTPERAKPFADLLAQHPRIITNNRLLKHPTLYQGDTRTPEQHIPPRGFPGQLFEVCMTMNDTWGFKKNDANWKSARQLLRNLSDIASKGGNYLLNVGPTADGVIPRESVERLEAIGRWMDVNAEAIHATEAGPFPRRLGWGRTTQKREADGTTTLYLHVWDWPADGKLVLPTLQQPALSARLLADARPVRTAASADGLVVQLTGAAPHPDISVVRLSFAAPVVITQEPFITPGPDGRVTLSAQDADAHGSWDGNIQLRETGPEAYLTDWTSANWHLAYHLKTPAAGRWRVSAEIAAPQATQLLLKVGKTTTPADIPATGEGRAWQTLDLGVIELPAGEAGFEFRAPKTGVQGLSLRHVWLTPATP